MAESTHPQGTEQASSHDQPDNDNELVAKLLERHMAGEELALDQELAHCEDEQDRRRIRLAFGVAAMLLQIANNDHGEGAGTNAIQPSLSTR